MLRVQVTTIGLVLLLCRPGLALGDSAPETSPAPDEPRAAHSQTPMNLGRPADPIRFNALLNAIDSRLSDLRRSVNQLESSAPQLAKFLWHLKGTHRWSDEKQERAVHDRFPATQLIGLYAGEGRRIEGFETDPRQLQARVRELSAYLRDSQSCAQALQAGADPAPASCRRLLGTCPLTIGWDAEGLFRYDVVIHYELQKIRVTTPMQVFDEEKGTGVSEEAKRILSQTLTFTFETCLVRTLLTPSSEPEAVKLRWNHTDGLSWKLDRFRVVCSVEPNKQPDRIRLKELASQFPDDEEIARELSYSEKLACEGAAEAHCQHVFKIRDTWAIAYVTAGCTVRRVTAKDLQDDVAQFGRLATEVQKQEHLVLADQIEACQAARAVGVDWKLDEPDLGSECKKTPRRDNTSRGRGTFKRTGTPQGI